MSAGLPTTMTRRISGALSVVLAIRSVITGNWSQQRSLGCCRQQLAGFGDPGPHGVSCAYDMSPLEVGRHFGATGHVVDTVPLALYCAQSIAIDRLEVVLAQAISIGGDTDTIAPIAGQLAGSVVGGAGVPRVLFSDIQGGDEVALIAHDFDDFIKKRLHNPNEDQSGINTRPAASGEQVSLFALSGRRTSSRETPDRLV